MKLSSKSQGYSEGEISLLSIFETLAASAVAIWFAYSGINRFFYIAIVFAPFLLLRTDRSSERAMSWSHRYFKAVDPIRTDLLEYFYDKRRITKIAAKARLPRISHEWLELLLRSLVALLIRAVFGFFVFIFVCLQILVFSISKVYWTLWGLYNFPMDALCAIPDNWRRVALATDLRLPPEYIPGIELAAKQNRYDFGDYVLSRGTLYREELVYLSLWGPAAWALVVYLPAYLYRWSLKSTVLFWSPLIWIVRPLRKIDDVVHFMRQVKLLSIYRVARIYSCIVLVLVAAKLYLLLLAANLLIHLEKVPGWETLAKYIVPDQLPIWHVAGTLNALLSLGLFFLSDYFLNEISSSKRVPIDTIRRIFETMLTVRNTLSVYSCLCIAYISVQVGGAFKLPPLEAKLFPW